MTETEDALKLLPPPVQPWVRLAKVAPRYIALIVAAVVPAITAYRSAAGDAQERAQSAKNKAEAGYQVTRAAMEALEHRVLVLEQAAHQVQAPLPKRGAHRPPPIPVAVTVHPKALPADLDKAERQVYRATQPRPTMTPDASP